MTPLWDPKGQAIPVAKMGDAHLINALSLVNRSPLFPHKSRWAHLLGSELENRKQERIRKKLHAWQLTVTPRYICDPAKLTEYCNEQVRERSLEEANYEPPQYIRDKEVWLEVIHHSKEHYQKVFINMSLTAVAEQSLGTPPAEHNYNNQEERSMSYVNGGPLHGLSVGDTAYSFISGAVTVMSLSNDKYRGRPIRVRAKNNSDMYASFQNNGVKKLDQNHQQLFLNENEMLMARDGHTGNALTPIMEITMERFTTQTLVNGQNIAHMSDDQIFSAIAQMEKEAETLGKIENKPARLVRQIADIKADITSIVTHLDAADDNDGVTATDVTS